MAEDKQLKVCCDAPAWRCQNCGEYDLQYDMLDALDHITAQYEIGPENGKQAVENIRATIEVNLIEPTFPPGWGYATAQETHDLTDTDA